MERYVQIQSTMGFNVAICHRCSGRWPLGQCATLPNLIREARALQRSAWRIRPSREAAAMTDQLTEDEKRLVDGRIVGGYRFTPG